MSGTGSSGTSSGGRTCTPEQTALCKKILATKNYYQILGVSTNATEDQLKKAYRRLAMQLHPDKNPSPLAEDAFKLVSKAYTCLTDADKRRIYDHTGSEDPQPQVRHHYRGSGNTAYRQGPTFEDMFGEHIFFRAFFGDGDFPFGGPGFGSRPRFQQRTYHQQQPRGSRTHHHQTRSSAHSNTNRQQSTANSIISVIPIFGLLIVYLLSSLLNLASTGIGASNHASFSLTRSPEFSILRHTEGANQAYYVSNDFYNIARDRERLREIEKRVDLESLDNLMKSCEDQRERRQSEMRRARSQKNIEEQTRLLNKPLSACDEVRRLKQGFKHLSESARYSYNRKRV